MVNPDWSGTRFCDWNGTRFCGLGVAGGIQPINILYTKAINIISTPVVKEIHILRHTSL
jgi:hypothetical protein